MTVEIDPEFQKESDEVQMLIIEKAFPILHQIDDDYPQQSAFFTMFVGCLHVLFDEGWSMAELREEVGAHYESYLTNLASEASSGNLH